MPLNAKILVLVTAGPTRAPVDRVRYISNYSTGELGYHICVELKKRGFSVLLIAGPTALDFESLKLHKVIRVETTTEMRNAVLKEASAHRPNFAVFSAAVLDFQAKTVRKGKVRSTVKKWSVDLVPTRKIVRDYQSTFPSSERIEFKLETGSRASLENLGKKLVCQHGSLAVVLNNIDLIRGQSHPALIVCRDGKIIRAATKKQIAKSIGQTIEASATLLWKPL